MSDIFLGQIIPFEFTISDQDGTIVDISSASVLEVIFRKPDKSTFTRTAAMVTDGTDGKLQYTTVLADLDAGGPWRAQAEVTISSVPYPSTISNFTVLDRLG